MVFELQMKSMEWFFIPFPNQQPMRLVLLVCKYLSRFSVLFKMHRIQIRERKKLYVRTFLQWICWYRLTTTIMDVVEAFKFFLSAVFEMLVIEFGGPKTIKRIQNEILL